MESKIFARLNFDPGILVIGSLIATIILIILVLILILRQLRLEMNYNIFMKGRGGRSLQDVFRQQLEGMDVVREQTDLLHKRLTYVEKSLGRSYQKLGVVKYDAFKDLGGQLSFAMAMLNDNNTGYVINSIHSRDGSYTYIKEIVKGECSIELCDEEQEALKRAIETAERRTVSTKLPEFRKRVATRRERTKDSEKETKTNEENKGKATDDGIHSAHTSSEISAGTARNDESNVKTHRTHHRTSESKQNDTSSEGSFSRGKSIIKKNTGSIKNSLLKRNRKTDAEKPEDEVKSAESGEVHHSSRKTRQH